MVFSECFREGWRGREERKRQVEIGYEEAGGKAQSSGTFIRQLEKQCQPQKAGVQGRL